jgi:hypothetical protein
MTEFFILIRILADRVSELEKLLAESSLTSRSGKSATIKNHSRTFDKS